MLEYTMHNAKITSLLQIYKTIAFWSGLPVNNHYYYSYSYNLLYNNS